MSDPGNIVSQPVAPSENPPAVAFGRAPQGKAGEQNEHIEDVPRTALIAHFRRQWALNKRAKALMDIRLLECERARRAQYTDQQIQLYTLGQSPPPYLPLAASKMRAAEAILCKLLLPEGERAWGIDPSPIPSLPPEIENAIQREALQKAQDSMVQGMQSGTVAPEQARAHFDAMSYKIRDEIYALKLDAERKEAHERARRMEDILAERQTEGNWEQALKDFINHFTTFPTAVLKGPYNRMVKKLHWTKNKPKVETKPTMYWSAVSPFDCYPAPQAVDCQSGCFIERCRFTRGELFGLIGLPGYDEAAIRRILDLHLTGSLESWLMVDMQRRAMEGVTNNVWKPDYIIDALHCWDSVQGSTLVQHGYGGEIEDLTAYYEIDAILIGNELIRVEINDDPLGHRPYRNASFDEVPGAFWGNSLYEMVKDAQGMANASFRAMNANLGLAAGPIIGVDVSKLAASEDPKAVKPLDIIQLDTQRSTNQDATKALIFFQADDRCSTHWQNIENCQKLADELSAIPGYLSGSGEKMDGGAETLGGFSMLIGMASDGIRKCVTTIDRRVTGPTMYDAYVCEMLYGDDEAAKGDCVVSPRGAAAIIVKEQIQESRVKFLQMTANPVDMQIIGITGRAKVLREVARGLHMDSSDIVPTDERLEAQLNQPKPPPEPSPDAKLKAQTDHEKNQTTKEDTQLKTMAKLATEAILHPEHAGSFAQAGQGIAQAAQFKTELSKPANAAYNDAAAGGIPPEGP